MLTDEDVEDQRHLLIYLNFWLFLLLVVKSHHHQYEAQIPHYAGAHYSDYTDAYYNGQYNHGQYY